MIKKLLIENFKGFIKLDITELKQITILAGKNHVGKSTVLEAIMLLNNPAQSSNLLPNIVNRENFMAMLPKFDIAIHGLFYNFDTSGPVLVKSDFLSMSIDYKENCEYKVGGIGGQNNVITSMFSTGMEFSYKDAADSVILTTKAVKHVISNDMYLGNIDSKVYKVLDNNVINTIIIDEYGLLYRNNNYYNAAPPPMQNIPSNMQRLDSTTIEFESIRNDLVKRKHLIDALKIIDADIIEVEYGNKSGASNFNKQTVEIRTKNLSSSLPLSVLGQGIKKIFNIVCGIVNNPGGILLIDELENGLHFSTMPHVWNIIYELSKSYNCQLIITTHSIELLKIAIDIDKFSNENFMAIDLVSPSGPQTIYSYDNLKHSITYDLEVRQ